MPTRERRRHDDNRVWPLRQYLRQGFEPIHHGHFNIEHDHARVLRLQQVQSLSAVAGHTANAKARISSKTARDEPAGDRGILNQHHVYWRVPDHLFQVLTRRSIVDLSSSP